MLSLSFSVIVPTYRPGNVWPKWLEALAAQRCQPNQVLIIDSSSEDDTLRLAARYGFRTHTIAKTDFDHGRTRMLGVEMLEDCTSLVVFLTQDALLSSPDSLGQLVTPFEDQEIGAVYGRQLPYLDSLPIAAHARLFSYPEASETRSSDEISNLGMRVCRFSNSFGAYRISALRQVGGFPSRVIFGEDQIAVSRMILAGWKVHYCANAAVYHAHDYSTAQEFQRYFDIGVMHRDAHWMLEAFGSVGDEGLRYMQSEFSYLRSRAPLQIPLAIAHNGAKFLGYRLGMHYKRLPRRLNRWFSMSRNFWK